MGQGLDMEIEKKYSLFYYNFSMPDLTVPPLVTMKYVRVAFF
jgi:hypothetical protein